MDRSKNKTQNFELLRSIGCGPESALMNNPRILGDGTLLESLRGELHEKLGADLAWHLLAQIGFYHGLRDSMRALSVSRSDCVGRTAPLPGTPAISLRIHGATGQAGTAMHGTWDDTSETRSLGGKDRTKRSCTMTSGYTSGWLSGLCDGSIVAVEGQCRNAGSNSCQFVARPAEAWRTRGDKSALALVDTLPFELFRRNIETLGASRNRQPQETKNESLDAIHVWGPVMVFPFREPDEALQAAETLEKSDRHDGIRVVVIDLEAAHMNPQRHFGPLASLLCRVESWGAEAVLANVSEELESIVSRLGARPLLTHSTRAEAIASAFQIVDAQKHLL